MCNLDYLLTYTFEWVIYILLSFKALSCCKQIQKTQKISRGRIHSWYEIGCQSEIVLSMDVRYSWSYDKILKIVCPLIRYLLTSGNGRVSFPSLERRLLSFSLIYFLTDMYCNFLNWYPFNRNCITLEADVCIFLIVFVPELSANDPQRHEGHQLKSFQRHRQSFVGSVSRKHVFHQSLLLYVAIFCVVLFYFYCIL